MIDRLAEVHRLLPQVLALLLPSWLAVPVMLRRFCPRRDPSSLLPLVPDVHSVQLMPRFGRPVDFYLVD